MAIWALLFVIGVILNACAVWGAPSPWFTRIAWLLWAVAAIIWLTAPGTGTGHLVY